MTVAILCVLIAIKTLPLTYVMIGLHLTHLFFTAICNLENTRMRDSTTFIGLILAIFTIAFVLLSIQMLEEPETIAKKLKDSTDPLI